MEDLDRLRDLHEYVKDFGDFVVGVDKIGGGTVGHEYPGMWDVVVYDDLGVEDIPVTTGMPHTHEWVANFVAEDLDSESW